MKWTEAEIDLSTVESMEDLERQAVIYWVKRCKGDIFVASAILGMGYATVYRKMKQYGVKPKTFRPMKQKGAVIDGSGVDRHQEAAGHSGNGGQLEAYSEA